MLESEALPDLRASRGLPALLESEALPDLRASRGLLGHLVLKENVKRVDLWCKSLRLEFMLWSSW